MELNRAIDHTLLRPDATEADIENLCREALAWRFHSVVVNPIFITGVARRLAGSESVAAAVVGFPLGANRTDIKCAEARAAIADGAVEIDVVANIGKLQTEDYEWVAAELRSVRGVLPPGTILKVIIETPLLRPERWLGAMEAVIAARADFVKTATGFFGPTPVEHVALLSGYAAGRIQIKAAGGIKMLGQATAMLAAGASRLGCSSSVAIMQQLVAEHKK